jgi:hypothetical protein
MMLGNMREQNSPAPSPNVGDVRWLGAKSVTLLCRTCSHQQVVSIEILPDDVRLALVASKFVCPQGHREAHPSQLGHVGGTNMTNTKYPYA